MYKPAVSEERWHNHQASSTPRPPSPTASQNTPETKNTTAAAWHRSLEEVFETLDTHCCACQHTLLVHFDIPLTTVQAR